MRGGKRKAPAMTRRRRKENGTGRWRMHLAAETDRESAGEESGDGCQMTEGGCDEGVLRAGVRLWLRRWGLMGLPWVRGPSGSDDWVTGATGASRTRLASAAARRVRVAVPQLHGGRWQWCLVLYCFVLADEQQQQQTARAKPALPPPHSLLYTRDSRLWPPRQNTRPRSLSRGPG